MNEFSPRQSKKNYNFWRNNDQFWNGCARILSPSVSSSFCAYRDWVLFHQSCHFTEDNLQKSNVLKKKPDNTQLIDENYRQLSRYSRAAKEWSFVGHISLRINVWAVVVVLRLRFTKIVVVVGLRIEITAKTWLVDKMDFVECWNFVFRKHDFIFFFLRI